MMPEIIDTNKICKSPFHDFVRSNPEAEIFLNAPGNYYQYALDGGETCPGILTLLNLTDAVSLEARKCIARRLPYWLMLDKALYTFLAFDQPAARHLIPKALSKVQNAILEKEWYELMPPFEAVRSHIETTISIQHYPYRKA